MEGALAPLFPWYHLLSQNILKHPFNAGSLVIFLPPKDKPNGSWGRLWTDVGMDLASTTI